MEPIALLRCSEYDVDRIEQTLRQGFELLGGEAYLRKLIPPGSTLLLKPNLLSSEPPGSAVVTDYRTFEAVLRIVKDYATTITFGDSPGFGDAKRAAESCGLREVAKRYGVAFDPFEEFRTIALDDYLLVPRFEVATAAIEADVLISLPRLKTHGMTSYTGAIKNQFGCIPGFKKAAWHGRMPRVKDFSRMLLDVNRLVETSFAILDGIVAMEGNGPKNGNPKKMDTLIMGESLSAVDSLAAILIGYDPMDIPYLAEARKSGFGATSLAEIDVLGERVEDMRPKEFVRVRGKSHMRFGEGAMGHLVQKLTAPKPVLIPEVCIGCKRCGEICPEKPRAISFAEDAGNKPGWNYESCIRCFCCQEICPVGAIEIEYPLIARMLGMDR